MSHHVTRDPGTLNQLTTSSGPSRIKMTDGQAHPIFGMGKVVFGASKGAIRFSNILYIPHLSINLLFVGKIADKQIGIYFDIEKVYLIEDTHSFV